MKLTFRQKSFLGRLLDLYREARQPMHYTEVARRLGLAKSSAYDMLRLLERKGLVISEYVLPKESPSPGRSHVRFWPTAMAEEIFSQSVAEAAEYRGEWEQIKAQVLDRLRHGKASARKAVLRDVINMILEARSPLAVCAEVITALLLSLGEVKHSLGPQSPLARLLGAPPTKLGMSLAAGLAAGMVQIDTASGRALDRLYEYVKRYEMSLEELDPDKLEALRRYAQDVMKALYRA
ncbi:MAG: helix-turn-helix domain-containing protein [Dehalococcoidia bacterium]|nr:helix-turn-helix domain-containing protein [Dehalococcoidia bacterium]